ncbi:MAG: type II toxin-antitoxin system PemK/MazF family toxin [Candidatus Pacebacteria bacterium]|nr:type II toxin-antitoxin system PemK/MazF family toxin [Candidatus Paceibacterota bacterium]MCF7862943.1 type II toxin-antitoxin system PemK/MazF family toxin [Candidatus Paceibacterota bacterium]
MKDFDFWNKKKKILEEKRNKNLVFNERDIWWCSIGLNIGSEQDGKNELFERPVLVIKKFNKKVCWVLPITRKNKEGYYYHVLDYNFEKSFVILSQLRLISTKRFTRFIRKISSDQFEIIKGKLVFILKNRTY